MAGSGAAAAADATTGEAGGGPREEEVEVEDAPAESGRQQQRQQQQQRGGGSAVEEAAPKRRRMEGASAGPGRGEEVAGGVGGEQAAAAGAAEERQVATAAAGSRGPPAAGRGRSMEAGGELGEEVSARRVRRRTEPMGSAARATSAGRMPWEGQPRWMKLARGLGGVSSDDEHDAGGSSSMVTEQLTVPADETQRARHTLRVTGPLVWCSTCAGYALRRWGVRLRGACRPRRGDATRRRLELLHQGRHPITGAAIL